MKKFNFTLGTVLNYKNQVLDSLKNEHAKILARINEQEKVIHNLEEEYKKCNNDFNQKKMEGITIIESIGFEAYLRKLEVSIKQEEKKENKEAEAMTEMNKQMQLMVPIMSVSIALIAPLGLALYWLVGNLFSLCERLILNKFFKKGEEDNG